MKIGRSTADSILRKIAARFKSVADNKTAARSLILGVGDDAALLQPRARHLTILTCDWFLEGTHFLRDKHPPDSVGWKALARALSDVAAMGGVPRCFLLSLALPSSCTGHWLDRFLLGLRRASREFRCPLAGGDTTRRNEILINVMVVGEIRRGRALLRSGARPGDFLFVSGRLGEAEWGLRLLRRGKGPVPPRNALTGKHLYPRPHLELGQWLENTRLATAMMDISDGLSSDLPRLCAASSVGARVEVARIPAVQFPAPHPPAGADALRLALHGGDDYELLFTIPPHRKSLVPDSFRGVPLTPIGIITSKKRIVLVGENGRERSLLPGGWDPFRMRS
jgi:thiamine-monophosphate kinase